MSDNYSAIEMARVFDAAANSPDESALLARLDQQMDAWVATYPQLREACQAFASARVNVWRSRTDVAVQRLSRAATELAEQLRRLGEVTLH